MDELYNKADLKKTDIPETPELRKYFERCNNFISNYEKMEEVYAGINHFERTHFERTYDMNFDILDRYSNSRSQWPNQRVVEALVRENKVRLERLWQIRACLAGALEEKDPAYWRKQIN